MSTNEVPVPQANGSAAFQVVQICPPGYIHSGALTELAECVFFGLRRQGLSAFYREPPNRPVRLIVIGAHLLGPQALAGLPHDAIIYNSEQIQEGSSWIGESYLDALKSRVIWDYSAENVRRLSALGATAVRHVPVGYVPELARIPQANEDIDILFYGSLNERRQNVLDELKKRGLNVVSLFGIYGEERDRAIARAKVVLMIHFYASKIFEVVRAAYLLTNEKAVVAECGPDTIIDPDLCESVRGVAYEHLVEACAQIALDPLERRSLAQNGRRLFARRREEHILAEALQLDPYGQQPQAITVLPARPATLHLGSGKDFKPEWLNLDLNAAWQPDAVVDIASPALVGSTVDTERFGAVALQENDFEAAIANDVLEHIHDLTTAMTNVLRLLMPGGILNVMVPYDLSLGAWQDPTHVRAFNERSWLYYTDWHWYLGWTDARFDVTSLELQMTAYGREMQRLGKTTEEILRTPRAVDAMRVRLRKRYLQESERAEALRRQPGVVSSCLETAGQR